MTPTDRLRSPDEEPPRNTLNPHSSSMRVMIAPESP
jgi:hypothetical protein